jgi:hypothetical protein
MGPLAHLVERLLCKQEATGSSPVGSTKKDFRKNREVFFVK